MLSEQASSSLVREIVPLYRGAIVAKSQGADTTSEFIVARRSRFHCDVTVISIGGCIERHRRSSEDLTRSIQLHVKTNHARR
jgi:hypothetical protein